MSPFPLPVTSGVRDTSMKTAEDGNTETCAKPFFFLTDKVAVCLLFVWPFALLKLLHFSNKLA